MGNRRCADANGTAPAEGERKGLHIVRRRVVEREHNTKADFSVNQALTGLRRRCGLGVVSLRWFRRFASGSFCNNEVIQTATHPDLNGPLPLKTSGRCIGLIGIFPKARVDHAGSSKFLFFTNLIKSKIRKAYP